MEDRQITREPYKYGYQGKFAEKDEETGWNHFEAREYDPVTGRWTVTDPMRQYASSYLGMGNNPVSRVDPDGRCDKCPKPGSPAFDEMSNGESWIVNNAEYMLVDKHAEVDGWVRVSLNGDNGVLNEIEVTPSYSFSEFTSGIVNPFVDVFTTLGSAIANGYTDAYYDLWKNESTSKATHYNSYELILTGQQNRTVIKTCHKKEGIG